MNDSVIFMINKGMAFMGYRQLDFGKPFIAAFDRQSGKPNILFINKCKRGPDFKLSDKKKRNLFGI